MSEGEETERKEKKKKKVTCAVPQPNASRVRTFSCFIEALVNRFACITYVILIRSGAIWYSPDCFHRMKWIKTNEKLHKRINNLSVKTNIRHFLLVILLLLCVLIGLLSNMNNLKKASTSRTLSKRTVLDANKIDSYEYVYIFLSDVKPFLYYDILNITMLQ